MIFNCDCRDLLDRLRDEKMRPALVFADPPDNLGLNYNEYGDKVPAPEYYDMIYRVIEGSVAVTDCFWLSYYWTHDLEIKYLVRNLIKFRCPTMVAKTFIWRYTFGQHNQSDFGSGYRFLLRLKRRTAAMNPDDVRVESERQRLGDSRASAAGRVPDDVWDIPRVVGNAKERRSWHPTQHPEALISRIVRMHSNEGDTCVDLFGGTGTMIRVCQSLNRVPVVSEIDPVYCSNMSTESGLEII